MNMLKAIPALLLSFLVQAPAQANPAVQPVVQVVQNLTFGGLLVYPQGGSITLTADGALLPLGSGVKAGAEPPSGEARFRITGPPGAAFRVMVEPSLPQLKGLRGETARIAEFQFSLPGGQGTFDGSGQAELRLGARLDIPAGATPALFITAPVQLRVTIAGGPEPLVVGSPFRISALLRAPLTLSCTGSLDFGALIPGNAPGEFQVLPDGGHRSLGPDGPTLIRSNPTPAVFFLQGPMGTHFSIQLPRSILLSGPGRSIQVHDFECDVPARGVLPPGGQVFHVGASLSVAPDQAYGIYRGTFTVNVAYQ